MEAYSSKEKKKKKMKLKSQKLDVSLIILTCKDKIWKINKYNHNFEYYLTKNKQHSRSVKTEKLIK